MCREGPVLLVSQLQRWVGPVHVDPSRLSGGVGRGFKQGNTLNALNA